ncbi:MAG TPA: hypothetical protein VNF71_10920 [Acidimicrobiales bacterium]|jgi:hypothetical protein|nr:hypothetical protein [Acidimicrobiales bacterium]
MTALVDLLTPDQLDGLACASCGRSFREPGSAAVPVGHRLFVCSASVLDDPDSPLGAVLCVLERIGVSP